MSVKGSERFPLEPFSHEEIFCCKVLQLTFKVPPFALTLITRLMLAHSWLIVATGFNFTMQ